MVQHYWQEGQFRGAGSPDRQCGEALELAVRTLVRVGSLSNK